jgi:hypothetical protein
VHLGNEATEGAGVVTGEGAELAAKPRHADRS